jgi:hypothetical protein
MPKFPMITRPNVISHQSPPLRLAEDIGLRAEIRAVSTRFAEAPTRTEMGMTRLTTLGVLGMTV